MNSFQQMMLFNALSLIFITIDLHNLQSLLAGPGTGNKYIISHDLSHMSNNLQCLEITFQILCWFSETILLRLLRCLSCGDSLFAI